ncbi:hypothetical protein [Glycomyces buryatensis]|uniref:Uncharacterized protein n=1 Tax=Glycomyces buryatensis TaxID=2570927 RepID=A0A4S8QH06_9ACTN|nr:hypothetical protein [Glycomyces buryatensis]THV43011.1 hypothetical protein FAB82_03390 [Glycomyces buryatensis]
MADRRHVAAGVLALTLAAGFAGCDADAVGEQGTEPQGVVYGLGDDHRLWRWQVDSSEAEPVLDLSGVWDAEGDVGTVLNASLSIDPGQRYAAWVAGGGTDAELMVGDLRDGETTGASSYPVDHACLDPTWLADGSALLVHRAAVWGEGPGDDAQTDATPMLQQVFGPTEWYSPAAGSMESNVDLGEGCRLRWYTAEDGSAEGIYHSLDVTELYRVDAAGRVTETLPVADLDGAQGAVTGMIGVDPSGRYVCLADGYAEHSGFEGGFAIRPQAGTTVVDLETGDAVGPEGASCESMQSDGYLSREDETVRLVDYGGEAVWETDLPDEIVNAPNLFYYPAGS